ncbi:MAG TPA: DHH family phosphoesterase [Ktedonobacterales bacterium]|jgi:single-stranded-DNA-specific exonuclease
MTVPQPPGRKNAQRTPSASGAIQEWMLPDGPVPLQPALSLQELEALVPPHIKLPGVDGSQDSRRLLAQLLANRGYTSIAQVTRFLLAAAAADEIMTIPWPPTPSQARTWIERLRLPDPHKLAMMSEAVARVRQALENKEPIIISGDYDADGLTALALLVTFLRQAGGDVRAFVPHRLLHGYGLNKAAIERGLLEGCKLLITVDSGTSDAAQIAEAQARGLDVIVTDHHTLPKDLPQAVAVINPHVGPYPGEGLTGVGVAWKLCQALCMDVDERWWRHLPGLLDLVAIGSVADVTPMTLESEVWLLARAGIMALRCGRSRPTIRTLIEAAGLPGELRPYLDARHIGFRIGPRLNAVGRLSEMRPDDVLEALLTEDLEKVREWVVLLDRANQQRQGRQESNLQEAEADLIAEVERAGELPPVLVLAREDWPAGIIGLLAGRLARRYQRPTLCLSGESPATMNNLAPGEESAAEATKGDLWWRGSGRSGGVGDLIAMLRRIDQRYKDLPGGGLFLKLGGHAPAAGFTLAGDRLELLKQGVLEDVREHPLGEAPREPPEAQLRRVGRSLGTRESWAALDLLTPTGPGNPEPRFYLEGMHVDTVQQVRDRPDLMLRLRDNGRSFTVFVNGAIELLPAIQSSRSVDLIVTQSVSRDKMMNTASIGLRVEALRTAKKKEA